MTNLLQTNQQRGSRVISLNLARHSEPPARKKSDRLRARISPRAIGLLAVLAISAFLWFGLAEAAMRGLALVAH